MSTFKCKMCGGTLEIQSGSTVAECEYCGAKQTLPKLDDEKRANLYDRANHFRRSNEFDKASAIYEQILAEDNTDAEAYWSLVLCRYGIEYVEDPLSHRRVPTVHRAQFTSIFDDDNYKSALKNSDTYQRVIYEEEAKAINEIQKGILAISQKEEPFDVFICYKETDDSGKRTHDSVLAQDLYYQLKQEGFKVFFSRITLEDKLGSAYEPYIFAALNSAKVMVVLGTKPEYFNAVWVKNEWSRFLSLIKKGEKKMLIPAYKDMDPYNLPKEFSHLQAQDMSKLGFMQDLIRGIKKILGRDKKPAAPTVERVVVQGDSHAQDAAPLLRRAFLFLEDGEFDNADEYAEKVLDINPECAEAYVVKLLIELRLKKPSDLAQCKNPISDSHNYQKALRFATPEYRETIEGYNNAIIKRIDTARKDEVYARGVELMRLHRYDEAVQYFQKIPTYKDSTQKIDDCKKLKETERRDGIYERATQLLNAGQFDEAARLFESIEDHKDSKEKIKLCGERKETARKDAIYSQAMNRVRPQNADDAAIKKSIEELQTISGYRDVDDQIRALNARLEKWYEDKKKAEEAARIKAEEDRRTREREEELRRIKAEKTKKTVKKVAKIGIPSVVALATLLILLFTLVIPLIRYNKADDLFNAGKYDEAMEIYQDIGGFSDSEQRITVLTGIEKIDDAAFEEGIEKILSAGVPVKLTYGMGGGDFSGTTYLSAPQEENNNGIVLLSASTTPNITPLATTTASVPETTEFTYNSSADFSGIQTPGRSGYRFVKWELETYNYQIGGTFEMKLNAVWSEKEYTIEYDLNDGKVTTNNPVEYGIEDDSFTLINPTKTGYTFIGWTGTGLDGLTMSVTIEKGSVGDRSYEANWQANTYTITLNPNGGSIANATITVTYDQAYTLNDPEWTGHTFGGWYEGSKKVTSGTWTRTSDLELTAKWDIVEYDITYNLNSGTNSSSNPATYTVDDEVILVAPTRTGYTFAGWTYTGQTTPVLSVTIPVGTIGDKEYTANWTADSYTLSFDADGGSVSPESKTVTYDASFTLPTPTKSGYTFAGWFSGTKQYTAGTWKDTSNITLKAHWTANTYTVTYDDTQATRNNVVVTFNYNYSGSTSTTVTLTNGQKLNYPTNPTRSGYVFAGWYTNSSCTTAYNFSGTITADMTLYANWKTCTITNNSTYSWSSSGGVLTSTNKGNSSSSTYRITATMPVTINFSYKTSSESGYDYLYIKKNGSQLKSCSGSTSYVSYSVTLNTGDYLEFIYSKDSSSSDGSDCAYIKDLTYTSNVSYTSTATASCSTVTGYEYANGETASTTVTFGSSHTLPALTRTGYSFLGWYNGTTKVESGNWSIASNVTLTPKWQAGGNTITLDANGGSVTPNSIPVSYDQVYTLPTPTWTGHTFAGWYNGSTQYSSGTWTGLSDITLTARWTTNDYSITFDDVAEINSTATITYNYNYSGSTSSTVTLTNGQTLSRPTNPTRSGYVFTGWYTNSSCTTRYEFTDTITGDMTLYAGWQDMSMSYVYTEVQIDPTDYTSSSDYYSVSTSSTSSSYKKHIYLVAEETGTHYIYWKNTNSYSYYGYYLQIYNLTTGTTIRSSSNTYSTSYQSSSFTCSKGDVIVISLYRYNTSYSSYAYFYFDGFDSPAASTAKASLPTGGYEYKNNSTYIDSVDYGANYTLPVPTRTGYTFGGWYNGSAKVENGTWNIASNVTLTAKWTANTYTVNFNANGGSVSPTSKTATYDSSFSLPTPTWDGHTFSGWYNGSTKVTSGTWKYTTGMTLTAHWDAVDYTISYTMNGGTNNSSNPSTYTVNDSFTLKEPTKAGYTFTGWTYSGQTTPTKNVTISAGTMGNLSYTANWQVNTYTVTFDANGGSVSPTSKTVTYDASYTLPTPTRTGYTFAGWYNGSTKYTGGTWKTASNTTLTASWTANSGIAYVVNHHKQNIAGTGYDSPEVENLTGTAGASITPSVKSYTGFTAPATQNFTVAPDGTLVVDYYYTRNSYTITMVTNGGNTITAITQKYQSALTMPTPTRTGYTFGGWFTNAELTTSFTSTTMPSSNTTVYAYWTEENKPSEFTYSGSSAITISGYKGTDTTVVVPSYIGGKVVKKIANSAFANKTNITAVTIPTTVEEIGTSVFAGCTSLTELVLPFIGSEEQTILPYTTTNSTSSPWTIGTDGVINSTNKGSSSSSTFKVTAIQNCSITFQYRTSSESGYDKLTISKNGTQLDQISGENSYKSLTVDLVVGDTLTFVYSKDGSGASGSDCAFIKGIVVPNAEHNFGYFFGTTSVSGTTEVVQNATTYYIPSSLRKVTSTSDGIADFAFENCTMLEEINVSGANKIGKNAFKNCTSLKRLNSTTNGVFNLPDEVTAIGEYAFYNCSQLVQITTGSDIKSIGQYAFSGCTALSKMNSTTAGSIIMLEGLESVGTYAFQNVANAKTVVVPSTVTSIGASAFSGCSTIESITLPFVGKSATANNAVDSVFGYIFGNNGETEAEGTIKQYYKSSTSYYNFYFIPTTIKNVTITNQAVIPFGAFSNCTFVENVTLTEGTTEVGSYAFYNCTSLNKVNSLSANTLILPDGLLKVGSYAFYNASTLTHVTIPSTVTSIGVSALKGCNSITDISLPFVGTANTTSSGESYVFGYIFGYNSSSTDGTTHQYYSSRYYYIPKTIKNVSITAQKTIPAYAFYNCDFIESVNIPVDATTIGSYAFYNCFGLKKLNSSTTGYFNIPTTVTKIDNYAFYKCIEFTHLNLGTSLQTLGDYSFCGCLSVTETNLPDTLEKIGQYAFDGCVALTKVGVEENAIIVPNGVTTIGRDAFRNLSSITKVVIPNSVTSIGVATFHGCSSITDITLPFIGSANTTSSGDNYVFGYIFGYDSSSSTDTTHQYYSSRYYYIPKSIRNVTITSQTTIPAYAFYNCDFIVSIEIPTETTVIGKYAFYNCLGLKKLNSTTDGLFNIPTTVTKIDEYTFYKCLLLDKFTCGDIATIGQYAFYGNASLTEVTIPNSTTSLGSYAFANCVALEKVSFGNNLTTISSYAFSDCAMLSKINSTTSHTAIIPDTVATIGNGAFKGCSEIYYWTLPFVGNTRTSTTTSAVFGYIFGYENTSNTITDSTNQGESSKYKYRIPKTIKSVTVTDQYIIPDYAFHNCSFIETINISNTVTEIGDHAFQNCTVLKRVNSTKDGEVHIPYMTKVINTYAFAGCSALTEISGGENLVTIGDYAFSSCANLSKVTLGNELKTIGNYAFASCGSLSQINSDTANTFNLPYGLSTIGDYAFQNATLVTKLVVPATVSKIGGFTFNGCDALVDVTLPFVGNTITSTTTSAVFGYIFGYKNTSSSVSNSTQQYSSSYKYYIPKTIRTVTITAQSNIPAYAFQNCSFIETINLLNNATTTAEKAFDNCSAAINMTITPVIAPSWNGTDVATGFESGTGTQADPYVIFSGAQLAYLAQQVNAGVTYENTYFILSADIVLGNKAFSVIGTDADHAFKGIIDGNNHVIRDFTITSDALAVGLFGYFDGTLKNLGVENCTIKATRTTSGPVYVGLIAYSTGTIENCYTRANVTASCGYAVYAGGMVGYNLGTIKNSYASGNVTATSTNFNAVAGGFVAHNEGTVNNCVAYGNVSATGYTETYSLSGGFVAENEGTITNCYRYADQTVKHFNKVGATNEEGTVATLSELSTYYASNWSATAWNFSTIYPKFK